MADIPPDVAARVAKGWGTMPPDVKERLTKAGLAPQEASGPVPGKSGGAPPPPSVSIPQGWRAKLGSMVEGMARPIAQGVGATIGAGLGAPTAPVTGPVGIGLGAGLGGAAGGQLYDFATQLGKGNVLGEAKDIPANLASAGTTAAADTLTSMAASAVDQKVIAPLAAKVASTVHARKFIADAAKVDQQETTTLARTAAGKALDAEKRRIGAIFDAVEEAGGLAPLPSFRAAALKHAEAQSAPIAGVSSAVKRGAALTTPNPVALTKVLAEAMPDLDAPGVTALATSIAEKGIPTQMAKELAEHAPHALAVLSEGERVPFGVARQAEKELSQLGGRMYLATPRQGVYRDLAKRIGEDLTNYLDAAAPEEAGKLAAAKAQWADYKGTAGRLVPKLFGGSKFAVRGTAGKPAEDAMKAVFKPGAVTITRDLQKVMPPEDYKGMVQAWLGSLHEQASATGKFSQRKFAGLVRKYATKGHLDVILEPLVEDGTLPGGADALVKASKGPLMTRLAELGAMRGLHGVLGGGAGGVAAGAALSHPVLGPALGVGVPAVSELMLTGPGRAITEAGSKALASPLTQPVLRRFLEQTLAAKGQQAIGSPP